MKTEVLVSHTSEEARDKWVTALRARLPDQYTVVTEPGPQVKHLVAWSPPPELFSRLTQLQTCFSAAAGVDHLLGNPSLPAELPVFRLEDAGMAGQMARYVRHEVERVLLRKQTYETQQSERNWTEHSATDPDELPVGLLGFGVLGRAIAKTLARDGYPVTAFRRQAGNHLEQLDSDTSVRLVGGTDQWENFLATCRVLVLIAPLTDATRHIIDAKSLATLPTGAAVINVGRGELIDTAALIDALKSKHLAGASLDVFDTEPLPEQDPLWAMSSVRITPHVSALTLTEPAAAQVANGIMAFDQGQPVTGSVDRALGY